MSELGTNEKPDYPKPIDNDDVFIGHADGCPAVKHFSENDTIFQNSSCTVRIGVLSAVSKEGVESILGWGLHFINNKKGHDHAYEFEYCPWCGGKLKEVK